MSKIKFLHSVFPQYEFEVIKAIYLQMRSFDKTVNKLIEMNDEVDINLLLRQEAEVEDFEEKSGLIMKLKKIVDKIRQGQHKYEVLDEI
ncbi:MAG: hypothetical protein CMB80_28475 [Flammeovirgaceae bacterium]|nr:hypothetical protein [Flammeovirgaceae bacterium]